MDSHLWPRLLLLSWGLVTAAGEAVRQQSEEKGMLYLRSPDTAEASGIPVAILAKPSAERAERDRKLAGMLERYFLEQPGYHTINAEMWARLSAPSGAAGGRNGCVVRLDAVSDTVPDGPQVVRASCAFAGEKEEFLGECERGHDECVREVADSIVQLIRQRTGP